VFSLSKPDCDLIRFLFVDWEGVLTLMLLCYLISGGFGGVREVIM
jgi:hypothetical protein